MAEHWRNTYGNGEGPSGLDDKLTAEGVRFVETVYGDVKFLEWAMRTRRGCGVVIRGGTHFVTLVALDNKQACVMDNNDVHNYRWMPRETFLAEWRASEGWAVAILGSPLAPLPY